jgi:hypothetical protein
MIAAQAVRALGAAVASTMVDDEDTKKCLQVISTISLAGASSGEAVDKFRQTKK